MPAIRALAARAVCPGLAFDDAVQEGLIGLFHAIENYDADAKASFSTYANVCAERHHGCAAGGKPPQACALNEFACLEDSQVALGPEEQELRAQEAYSSMLHSIETRLSRREKQVLALFLDGCSYGEIGAAESFRKKPWTMPFSVCAKLK